MKLYDFAPAANAQRVRVFLAEKGLEVPTVELNVREGNQYKDAKEISTRNLSRA
jgi:glutathione S-transferase